MGSKIDWTDEVWSVVTGCTPVSPGCKHCYAERIIDRFPVIHETKPKNDVAGMEATPRYFSDVHLHPNRLEKPFHWRKSKKIFVVSMGDLFHPDVPFAFIAAVFGVMAACPQHIFQLLTKRPARMLKFFKWVSSVEYPDSWKCSTGSTTIPPTKVCIDQTCNYLPSWEKHIKEEDWERPWPLKNVWIGVTVENQKMADERIPILLQCLAVLRFVSIEPMLSSIDMADAAGVTYWDDPSAGIGWAICGAESGTDRRTADISWIRSLRDQCINANIPFFLKQMDDSNGQLEKMPILDGKVWDQFPATA